MNDCIVKLINKKQKRLASLEAKVKKYNSKPHKYITKLYWNDIPAEIMTLKNQLIVLEQVKHEC